MHVGIPALCSRYFTASRSFGKISEQDGCDAGDFTVTRSVSDSNS